MATNICSRTRVRYITPKEFAEQYKLSKSQTYKMLAEPFFKEAIFKPSEKLIRIDHDKAIQIMKQRFNS